VLVAVTGCAVGFAVDAGSGKDLTAVFAAVYAAGCVAAVLAVRQSGIFTAVIQPPLILFCAVPGGYFLLHGARYTGLKDLLINCGYPLIERFPLMLFTAAGVLVLGLIRWYLGRFHTAAADATDSADAAGEGGRLGLVARLTALFNREPADETVDKAAKSRSRRTHAVERSARSTTSDARRTGKRPASTRTQRQRPPLDGRPPLEDGVDPARERARRRRPSREFDAAEPPRRPRLPRDPDPRGRPPRETRHDPYAHRERPAGRFDPYEPTGPFDAVPAPPPRRGPAPNGHTATHHPISQVRYRKAAGGDEPLDDRAARPRRPRKPESWD
jgi:hypothetical protein